MLYYRCSSKDCRKGFFYGFCTEGRKIYYDINCLEKPFFFTFRKSGFSVDLLYEFSLNIVHFQATYVLFMNKICILRTFSSGFQLWQSSTRTSIWVDLMMHILRVALSGWALQLKESLKGGSAIPWWNWNSDTTYLVRRNSVLM